MWSMQGDLKGMPTPSQGKLCDLHCKMNSDVFFCCSRRTYHILFDASFITIIVYKLLLYHSYDFGTTATQRVVMFKKLLPVVWIRPATDYILCMRIAVPNSQSPQHS